MKNFDFMKAGSCYLNKLRRTPEEAIEDILKRMYGNKIWQQWQEERTQKKE